MKSKAIIVAGLVIAAAAALLALTTAQKRSTSANEIASVSACSIPSPAWELKGVDGKPVKSSDFGGKVVILDFWATWCGPCRMEILSFIELQKQYEDKGFVVVGVSLDQDGASAVNSFMDKTGINYPVVLGDETIVNAFGGIEGIPTTFNIDRSGHIAATLEKARKCSPHEIIVVEGGSGDETCAVAQKSGATVIHSKPGRARQMNAGASRATGNVLLFLYADTLLPENWMRVMTDTLGKPEDVAGSFGFRAAESFPGGWLVEWTTNLRSRWFQNPYCDQTQFLRRALFEELGGFANLPIMEDYELRPTPAQTGSSGQG